MTQVFSFLFILVLGTQSLHAQDITYARRVVEDLSSPAMYGRGFTHNGINRAAHYIIKEYRKNGALPFNGSYNQWFRVNVNTFPGAVKLFVNGTVLKPGTDFLPHPSSKGIRGSFGLVEVNTADILSGHVILKMQDATKDQMLYLNLSATDTLDKAEKKTITAFKEQLKSNMNTHVAGILESAGRNLTWHSSGHCLNKPWIVVNDMVIPDSLCQIKIAIKSRLLQERKTRNIIGYCRGKLKPDSFIIFSAHYDHLGSLGRTTFFPGANDNASGVAMMLSLMRYYASHPPDYSILFLATSAEELGIIGAMKYVENPVVDHKSIRFLINLDLIGTGEEGIMVVNGSVFSLEFEKLMRINDRDSLLTAIKSRGEACNSDHCPFYLKGVPCFFIYTLGGNASYHDPFDKYETLSMAAFENLAELIVRFIRDL